MEFDNSFDLQAPIDDVWRTLLDVERVAPCMPGAEVLGRDEDGAYRVAVKVTIGPMAMKYKGRVEISEEDEAAHRAVMRADAKEARGQGTAAAEIEMALAQEGETTRCAMHTDVKLSGKAAAMGQGVIRDVSAQLIAQFSENLAAMMGAGGAEAAAPAPEGAATAATAAAGAEARPAAAAPAQGASLEAGALMAKVIAGRLENPRTLALTASAFGLLFLAIGFLIGWLAT